MTPQLIIALDAAALLTTVAAALFWYRASQRGLRRLTIHETFDYHDLNRIVNAINRNNILNRRAALASGGSALLIGLRMMVDLLSKWS
jgi:hypothetical protein